MAITQKIIQSPEDFQTLDRLIKEIWPEVFTPIIGSDQVAYMLAHYQSPAAIQKEVQQGAVYLLLMEGDQAVGYTAYEETPQQLYLSKLYLHQSTRGKGYASQVFDWYEEIASGKTLHLNVNKQNQQAIAVYEHRGFQRVSERSVAIGSGFVMDDFIYDKEIAEGEGAQQGEY